MTGLSHGVMGYSIGAMVGIIISQLFQICIPITIVIITIGSLIALITHLVIDRLIYEWGFWKSPLMKDKIIGGAIVGCTWIVYILLISFIDFNPIYLIPAFFGMLPDISGIFKINFPYHENHQTFAGTLSSYKTMIVETFTIIPLLLWMIPSIWTNPTTSIVIFICCIIISLGVATKYGIRNNI